MQSETPGHQQTYDAGPEPAPLLVRVARDRKAAAQVLPTPAGDARDAKAAEPGAVPYAPTDAELRAYSLDRQLETAKRRVARLQVVLGYVIVAVLAFGLRAWFLARVNKFVPVWDADLYWNSMLAARDAYCQQFGFCVPTNLTGLTLETMIYDASLDRRGLLPLLGAVMTVLPRELISPQLLNAFLDTLVCLMVIGIARRWGLPLWAALVAGLFQALYVPAITGDGAVIQQPYIRFFLVATIWAYTYAFTTKGFWQWLWAGVGTVLTVIVGFTNQQDRPLMWLIPALVIVLSSWRWRLVNLGVAQTVHTVVMVVALLAFANHLHSRLGTEDSRSIPLTGLSAQGSAGGQSTVLTYDHLWQPEDWGKLGRNTSETILKDVEKSPVAFGEWWNYGLYANWRYPDYTYFQVYLLDYEAQKVQHKVLLVLGLAGLAGLLGIPGRVRRVVALTIAVGVATSLLYAMITIEPRRLSVLTPFLAIGLGAFCWGAVSFATVGLRRLWEHRESQALRWGLWALLVAVLVWLIPLHELVALAPGAAGVLHTVVVLLHAAAVVAAAGAACVIARFMIPDYRPWLPTLAVAALMVSLAAAQLRDPDWRAWSAQVDGSVRQAIAGVNGAEHLHPWLLIDPGSREELRDATITVDGRVVKPPGGAVYLWRAGVPPLWFAYNDLINMATHVPPLRTWLAVPVPRDLVSDGAATVQVDPGSTPLTLYGDYLDSPGAPYAGPLINPWYDGSSFWRWQWDASDPRISAEQNFGGNNYSSSYLVSVEGPGSSERWEQPPGLYRIFLAWEAFGPRTNSLLTFDPSSGQTPPTAGTPPTCPVGTLLAGEDLSLPFVCLYGDQVRYYLNSAALIGTSSITEFARPFRPYDLMKRIEASHVRVDVIGAMRRTPDGTDSMFVANTYNASGALLYSSGFWLMLPPSR